MEELRTKQKVVNKNSWQVRLYKYVYKRDPFEIRGFCKFFWSVWVAIILLPFVICADTLSFIIGLISDFFPEKEERYDYPLYNFPSDSFLLNNSPSGVRYYYSEWVEKNPNWEETILVIVKAAEEKRIKEQNARELKQVKLQEKREKIVSVLKHLVFPAMIGSVLLIGYILYKFVFYVAGIFEIKDLLIAAAVVIGLLSSILILKGICGLFSNLASKVKKVNEIIKKEEVVEKESPFKFLSFIPEFFNFVIDTFKVTYYKQCPLLKFSNETKPIEKIKHDSDS